MRAGKLRDRVTVEIDMGTADSYGQVIPDWRPYLTNVPASVVFTSGNEQQVADQQVATKSYKVTLRYTELISATMRVKWCNRILNVQSAGSPDEGRRQTTVLVCTERP